MKNKMNFMLRKALAIMLSMALFFTAIPGLEAFAETAEETPAVPSITVESTTVKAGNAATVYVYGENFESISGLQFAVSYDAEALAVTGAWECEMLSGQVTDINYNEAGIVKASMISVDGVSGNGYLLGFNIKAKSDASPKDYVLRVSVTEASNVNFETLEVTRNSGLLTVEEPEQVIESASFHSGITNSSVETGEEFTYYLNSSNIGDLAGGDFIFKYDPDMLQLVDVKLEDFLLTDTAVYSINKKTPGYVKISYADIAAINNDWSRLFDLTFKAKDKATDGTAIQFSTAGLVGEDLNAMKGNELSRTVAITKPVVENDYPDFALYWDGILDEASRTLTVTAALPADTNVAAGDFTIAYDKADMVCTAVTESAPEDGIIVTKEEIGEGTVKFSYVNTDPTSAATELIKMTFTVTDGFTGKTTLSATGKSLVNEDYKAVLLDYPSRTLSIDAFGIGDKTVTGIEDSYIYTGNRIVPEISVEGLTQDKDYTVEISNNLNIGTATVIITGIGSYGGTITKTFTIKPAAITGVSADDVTVAYDGKAHSITVNGVPDGATVTYATEKNGTYTKTNPSLTAAGTMTVYYKVAKANYNTLSGSAAITVNPADISGMTVSNLQESYVYTGSEIKPAARLTGLAAGTDFVRSYENNINAGTATLILTGQGNYAGTIEKTFTITPASIEGKTVSGITGSYIYDGTAIKPEVSINGLTAGTDFTVEYTNNVNVGTATVTITGTGNYTGTIEKQFTIMPHDLEGITVLGYEDIYDGEKHGITISGTTEDTLIKYSMTADGEYTTEKPTFANVGDYTVYYIISRANYNDITGMAHVIIHEKSIEDMTVRGIDDSYVYTGSAIRPAVTIEGLAAGTAYTVQYADNVNVGTATVTITGAGNYNGVIEKTFEITPADMTGITVEGYTGTYDGQAHGLTFADVSDGAVVTYAAAENGEYTSAPITRTAAGTSTVFYRIEKANYKTITGSADIVINQKSINNMAVGNLEETYVFTGNEIEPEFFIEGLTAGTDYAVAFENNVNVGTATVTIVGKGNYKGSIEKNFAIIPADFADVTIKGYEGVYDGKAHSITINGAPDDAVITYSLDGESYTAVKPSMTGAGQMTVYYRIEKTHYNSIEGFAKIIINQKSITGMTISGADSRYVYTGSEITPEISIAGLESGTDYTVEYKDNVNAGIASIVVTAKGNYCDTITKTFAIKKDTIDSLVIGGYEGIYDGSAHSIIVAGEPDGTTVEYSVDEETYTAENPGFTDAGTYTVYYRVTGKNYSTVNGSEQVIINQKDISEMTVSGLNETFTYSGDPVEPAVGISNLTKDTDFEVAYANNTNAGTATVTITGVGNYTGTIVKTYEIIAATMDTITASGYEGLFDRTAHSITVSGVPAEAAVEYSLDGINYTAENPSITDIGTMEVYYRVVKENYRTVSGKETVTINPVDISQMTADGINESYVYTGLSIKPAVTIEGLTAGTEFAVEYSDNIGAGTATVTIKGVGNFTGSITKTFAILPAELQNITVKGYEGIYDGREHSITVTGNPEGTTVTYSLTADGEYTAAKPGLADVGELTVYYKIQGSNYSTYTGQATVVITQKSIEGMIAKGLGDNFVYTGSAVEPVIRISGLTAGTDFTVSATNNIDVGTANVVITGTGNYTGTIEGVFYIVADTIEGRTVTFDAGPYDYDGSAKTPAVTVEGLTEGTDFEVEYENNINAGTAGIYIKGINGYGGLIAETFEILPIDLEGVTVTGYAGDYDGQQHSVTIEGLPEGVEVLYSLTADGEYTDEQPFLTNVGSMAVYCRFVSGNYNPLSGSADVTITPADISGMAVTGIENSYVYTGEAIAPEIAVKGLTADRDYIVEITDNLNVGTATVTITGIGNYTGSITGTFKIKAADMKGITSAGYEGIYDGEKHGITVTGVPAGASVTYSTAADGEYKAVAPTLTDKGTLTVYYKVEKDNYNTVTGSETVIITAKDISGMTVTGVNKSYVYTGEAIVPDLAIEGLVKNTDYIVNCSNNTNAGFATIVITGMGNYKGSQALSFAITKATMKGISASSVDNIYDGKPHGITVKGVPEGATVTYATSRGGTYTEVCPTITDVGSLTVYYKVEKANYNNVSGYATVTVEPASIENETVTGYKNSYVYTGSEIKPVISVGELAKNTDYTVEFANNCDAGTATITITGQGNYTGVIEKTFEITPAVMEDATVRGYTGVYDGNAHGVTADIPEGASIVYCDTEDGDYQSGTFELTDAGTQTVYYKVTKPNYQEVTGSVTITIKKADISDKTMSMAGYSYVYTGSEIRPVVSVDGLTPGIDYDVKFANNTNVGEASVTVTGIGNYTGSKELNFEITPAELEYVYGYSYEFDYDGQAHGIDVSVPAGAVVTYSTSKDGEYTTLNPQFTDAGVHTVYYKVTKDNYKTETGSNTVTINAADISGMTVKGLTDNIDYTGSLIEMDVSIEGLTAGVDYKVEYMDNLNAGTATVIITGQGNYTGTIQHQFEINRSDMKGVTVTGYEGVYDGLMHCITIEGVPDGAVITYALDENGEYFIGPPSPLDVCDMTVYYRIEKENYNPLTGSAKIVIKPASIEGMTVSGLDKEYVYTGDNITPAVTINGLDPSAYTVDYFDAANVGNASVVIRGQGNYTGEIVKTYEIVPAEMVGIEAVSPGYIYNGKPTTISFRGLPEGAVVTYAESADGPYTETPVTLTNVGTKTVYYKISKPNYKTVSGSIDLYVTPAEISQYNMDGIKDTYLYTGKPIEPKVTIEGLTEGKDFKVTYTSNIDVGEGYVGVEGIGNYTGTMQAHFQIVDNSIEGREVKLSYTSTTYDGTAKKPAVTVSGLIEGTQYTVSYSNNINAGTATVTINGAGSYAGTITKTFTIKPASISDRTVGGYNATYNYTGKAIEPAVTVNGLTKGKDYTVSYKNNIAIGTATIVVKGTGNYTGTIEEQFEIVSNDLSGVTASGYVGVYDGAAHGITVLGVPSDATVTYADSASGKYSNVMPTLTNVGTRDVYYKVEKAGYTTVTGRVTISISPLDISNMEPTGLKGTYVYTGEPITPAIQLGTLVNNVDYNYSCLDNIEPGYATLYIEGVGNCTGSITRMFYIEKIDISDVVVKGVHDKYLFTGEPICPVITIDGLELYDDYIVAYSNNDRPGTATITISGMGNYTGTKVVTFLIESIDGKCTHSNLREFKQVPATCTEDGVEAYWFCNDCERYFGDEACTVNLAGAHEIKATGHSWSEWKVISSNCEKISYNRVCDSCGIEESKMEAGKGHSYKTFTKVITRATQKATGKQGTYKYCTKCQKESAAKQTSTSVIKKIAPVKMSATDLAYSGKSRIPTLTVKDSAGKKLKKGTDYKVTIKNSKGKVVTAPKAIGKYKITVTFLGKYKGYAYKNYNINPKGTTLGKLKAGKKQITVKWTKKTVQVTGYQIRYSTKSSMNGSKTVLVKSNKTTTKTIKNLKAKKKYYVQVRTYKTVNGKKFYSAWSAKKSIKTK